MTTSSVPDRNDASTNGWNSVFAINFDNANYAITAGWPEINDGAKNIKQAAPDDPSYNLDAVFGPWQFTIGGDGKNIRMACTFISGKYKASSKSYDLAPEGTSAAEVIIEVGMEWVPDPAQKSFVISGDSVTGIITDLDNNKIDTNLSTDFANNKLPLSDSATTRVVTNGEQWHVTDGDIQFYIFYSQDKENDKFLYVYKFEKSWATNLKVLSQAVSASEPAVSIITIANNPTSGIAADVLPQLLSVWFNDNISEFNHVFSVLDLAPEIAASDKYSWDKPTATSYAVVGQGALDNSIFGVLTMNQLNTPGDNHEISPYAIPTGTDANGADAGFLISGPDFVKYMMLGGAQVIFDDAVATDFEIINDHLTVQNTKELTWGKFMMDNKKKGSVANDNYTSQLDQKKIPNELELYLEQYMGIYVSGLNVEVTTQGSQWLLTNGEAGSDEYILSLDGNNLDVYLATVIKIQKGGFKMSLIHSYVEIEFIGLTYPYSSDFNISINYTEQVVLTLKNQGGKQIFWFDQVFKNMVVSVTKTQSAITREIIEGAVTGVLSLVAIAGPIIEGLSAAAEVGEVTEAGGDAIIDSSAFARVEEDNPSAALQDSEASAGQAAEQTGGKLTNIKNAFATPKWKFAAALAGLAGAVAGFDTALTAIAEAAAKNEWEKVPGFDDFANTVIAPYTFPHVTAFDLKSAWLADSLQIGLKAQRKS